MAIGRLPTIAAISLLLLPGLDSPLDAAQRMALPALDLKLAPRAGGAGPPSPDSFKDVPSMCLDSHRPPPSPRTPLLKTLHQPDERAIVVGGVRMTLQQAINQKKIEIQGLGGYRKVRIVNLTDQQVTIDTPSPSVLGETESGELRDSAEIRDLLSGFSQGDSGKTLSERQIQLWSHQKNKVRKRLNDFVTGNATADDVLLDVYGVQPQRILTKKGFNNRKATEYLLRQGGRYEVVQTTAGVSISNPVPLKNYLDETPPLSSINVKRLEAAETVEFARARNASDDETAYLIFGTRRDNKTPIPVQLGRTGTEVSPDELDSFYSGGPVPESLRQLFAGLGPTDVIVWTSPYQTPSTIPALKDRGQIVRGLKNEFPELRIVLDSDNPNSHSKLRSMPGIASGDDVAILDHSQSLPEGYQQTIKRLRNKLSRCNINVFKIEEANAISADNIVLLTGDKKRPDDRGQSFPQLVRKLQRSGHLRGKVLVLFSCGMGGEAAFNRELLDGLDAPLAICYYNEKISPAGVQRVLSRITALLQDNPQRDSVKSLIDEAVEKEINASESEPVSDKFLQELKKLQHLILQVRFMSERSALMTA